MYMKMYIKDLWYIMFTLRMQLNFQLTHFSIRFAVSTNMEIYLRFRHQLPILLFRLKFFEAILVLVFNFEFYGKKIKQNVLILLYTLFYSMRIVPF